MRNLAGHENPDSIIEEELFIAGVPAVRGERSPHEVAASVTGKLGGFVFTRAWYYWVVDGPVPYGVAQEIYEQQPYGRRDVRVAGHCGCPPPEDPWLTYRAKDGRLVIIQPSALGQATKKEFPEVFADWDSKFIEVESKSERVALAVSVYVENYHIDSQGGLKVFVDALRKHGIV